MLLLSLPTLLIALLGLANIAHSCRPSVWAIGLSANHTLDNHLRIVGRPISIQECRSEINGYTASIADDDKTMFEAIRSDLSVGFVTKIHQDYFRKFDDFIEAGWDDDDRDFYEHMKYPRYQWDKLQFRDPEIIETETTKLRRVPLEWVVRLEEGYSLDVFINLITQFNPNSVLVEWEDASKKNNYYLVFRSEEQERKSLPLIRDDYRVKDFLPTRCWQPGITYWVVIDGEEFPGWEDICVWSLGYRQWDKEPIVSVPSKPPTHILHPQLRNSYAGVPGKFSAVTWPTQMPVVNSWEAVLAKDRMERHEMIAWSHHRKMMLGSAGPD